MQELTHHVSPFFTPHSTFTRHCAGLSPEYVMFNANGLKVGAAYNMLRPEALEAMW